MNFALLLSAIIEVVDHFTVISQRQNTARIGSVKRTRSFDHDVRDLVRKSISDHHVNLLKL